MLEVKRGPESTFLYCIAARARSGTERGRQSSRLDQPKRAIAARARPLPRIGPAAARARRAGGQEPLGLYWNFWPPTDTPAIAPPLRMTKVAMPR